MNVAFKRILNLFCGKITKKLLQMGEDSFFCQMMEVGRALHIAIMHEQECGELAVYDVDGVNRGDLDETEWIRFCLCSELVYRSTVPPNQIDHAAAV